MPYHERLKSLGLYTLQRRRERYCIIYIWKIIEGLALNFSNPITSTFSGRRGRSCVISHVNVCRVGTLPYNSFRWRSSRLFNSLPMHLRSMSSCSVQRSGLSLVQAASQLFASFLILYIIFFNNIVYYIYIHFLYLINNHCVLLYVGYRIL